MFLLSVFFFLKIHKTELLVLLTPPKLAALAAFRTSNRCLHFYGGPDLSLGVIFLSSLSFSSANSSSTFQLYL